MRALLFSAETEPLWRLIDRALGRPQVRVRLANPNPNPSPNPSPSPSPSPNPIPLWRLIDRALGRPQGVALRELLRHRHVLVAQSGLDRAEIDESGRDRAEVGGSISASEIRTSPPRSAEISSSLSLVITPPSLSLPDKSG